MNWRLPPLPEDAIERHDELSARIDEHQQQCKEWKAQWVKLRDQARALPINEGLRRNCCRIEALGEQEGWLNSIRDHIKWLNEEIGNVETQLFTEREELGLGDAFDWEQLPQLREHAEREFGAVLAGSRSGASPRREDPRGSRQPPAKRQAHR